MSKHTCTRLRAHSRIPLALLILDPFLRIRLRCLRLIIFRLLDSPLLILAVIIGISVIIVSASPFARTTFLEYAASRKAATPRRIWSDVPRRSVSAVTGICFVRRRRFPSMSVKKQYADPRSHVASNTWGYSAYIGSFFCEFLAACSGASGGVCFPTSRRNFRFAALSSNSNGEPLCMRTPASNSSCGPGSA